MAMLSRAGDWDTRITTCNIGGRAAPALLARIMSARYP